MSVDRNEVERIAKLARLSLDESEVVRLTDDMNRILDHATRLGELIRTPGETGGGVADSPDGADRGADGAGTPATSGTRDAAASHPDRLERGPELLAPVMWEGFFVVPPPPGVTADDAGGSGAGGGPLE